jgi:type II restriction/modification system DNA methylase subunit YeeA
MTPDEFIAKWKPVDLSERSACQQHFLDLCELFNQSKPAAADPEGAWYTFEKGVHKTEGGQGWADVWMKNHFGWEYKGKHRDLRAAYSQLQQYREALENPPLLVVCDLDRFEIHTNFTGTITRVYAFDLDGLAQPANLDVLRKLFTDPDALKPGQTTEALTKQAAELIGLVADGMWQRGIPAHDAAHFLMKLIFCMFAEDIGLLPNKVFTKALAAAKKTPDRLANVLKDLFEAMAHGGYFGADEILYFNGGLFADSEVIDLQLREIEKLNVVCQFDWSDVEPSIFGTLFERTLDPAKRSQIGAHYTSREDILTLLEPVMMAPLRREWEAVKAKCEKYIAKIRAKPKKDRKRVAAPVGKEQKALERTLQDFSERLAHVTVLDPACGSGNFLYVAINLLLNLEKEVIAYGATNGVTRLPQVRPTQLAGIEKNEYAQQLAQIVIWIGYLQWMHHNGFKPPSNPVLEPIESIRLMDAIIDLNDLEHPTEPEWPTAEFIVGNPPFLGNKRMRSELGGEYVERLWKLYGDRLPATSDLCCYWFERANSAIRCKDSSAAGLLATTAVRQVGSRAVVERILENCRIFFAISDRDWILDGASVRISMIGWSQSDTSETVLDGKVVKAINADLTGGRDLTNVHGLKSNAGSCFMGVTKVGNFDVSFERATSWLPISNPNSRPNSDVLRPFRNGSDLVRTSSDRWIVDFGVTALDTAARYEAPFEFLSQNVKAFRANNGREAYRERWWIHGESRPGFRAAVGLMRRFIATARVAKHRLFVWLDSVVLPDSKVIAIARDDDRHFGVLQSRTHEVWTLASCGWHGVGNDATYNPTTCYEPFAFPDPTMEQETVIATAAKELDTLRNNWLNPPEWVREEVLEFPGSVDGPWARYVHDADGRGIGTVRYPRLVPKNEECAKELKKRTLTNLYNQKPTWLTLVHKKLDNAVFAAYGWPADLTDEQILEKLLALNLERAKKEAAEGPTAKRGRRPATKS